MRYKSFIIKSFDVDYDIYSEDTPTLGDIEIGNVTVTGTPPRDSTSFLRPLQVTVAEDHPFFNFDIWGDVVDLLDEDYHIPDNSHLFRGAQAVNDIIAEYFPNVIDYYKHQI